MHVLEAEDSAYLFCVRSGVMARNRPVDLARAFSHAGEKGGLAQVSTHTAAIVRVPCTKITHANTSGHLTKGSVALKKVYQILAYGSVMNRH